MIPTFVQSDMFLRRRERWTVELKRLPGDDARKNVLRREFQNFYLEFLTHPGTSEAASVNVMLALMQEKGMELPIAWLDLGGLEETTADTPLIVGCRAACRREEAAEQRKAVGI